MHARLSTSNKGLYCCMISRHRNDPSRTTSSRTIRLIARALMSAIATLYVNRELTRNNTDIDDCRAAGTGSTCTITRLQCRTILPSRCVGNRETSACDHTLIYKKCLRPYEHDPTTGTAVCSLLIVLMRAATATAHEEVLLLNMSCE